MHGRAASERERERKSRQEERGKEKEKEEGEMLGWFLFPIKVHCRQTCDVL
jgi:hypothetical protein